MTSVGYGDIGPKRLGACRMLSPGLRNDLEMGICTLMAAKSGSEASLGSGGLHRFHVGLRAGSDLHHRLRHQ